MNFSEKIAQLKTTEETVDFINNLNYEVSFIYGRKFSFDKNSEKISYNQLIEQINQKVKNTKWDGSIIATSLKQLDNKAEECLTKSNFFIRLCTYVKRIFSRFPRVEKLNEINQVTLPFDVLLQREREKEREVRAEKLRSFYEKKGFVTGKEPIEVDIESLGLDLTEEFRYTPKRKVTLKEATEIVVAEINRLIQESPEQASIKEKRNIHLSTSKEPFSRYNDIGLPDKISITEEEAKQSLLRRIIDALVEKGHLFELELDPRGYGHYIQA